MMMARSANPAMKIFQPVHWFGHIKPAYYLNHLSDELRRLGLELDDIGRRTNGPSIVAEVLDWMTDRENEAALYDWQRLNLEILLKRASRHEYTRIKPRIDLIPYITARDNLSVIWYPTGWRQYHWNREKLLAECDFLFFHDEGPLFQRPDNELMFIHGVGNLRPDLGMEGYEHFHYNRDVVEGILLCLVRSAYETLIRHLEDTFEVTQERVFVFEERDDQVVGWKLRDPVEMQREKDEAELAEVPHTYGFTVELFNEHLEQVRLAAKDQVNDYSLNERLARRLTKAGHKMTRTRVEHLRGLLDRLVPPPRPENVLTLDQPGN